MVVYDKWIDQSTPDKSCGQFEKKKDEIFEFQIFKQIIIIIIDFIGMCIDNTDQIDSLLSLFLV